MEFSSDSDFEIEFNEKKDNSSELPNDKFLEACSTGNYDYVKKYYKENIDYLNQGISKACQNKHKSIISFLMNKGVTKCKNCEKTYGFKATVITPHNLYIRKKKFTVIAKNQDKSFGDIAKILYENWKNIDRYEKSLIENEVQRLNKKNLKCLEN